MRTRFYSVLSLFLILLLIAGCGGGGGISNDTEVTGRILDSGSDPVEGAEVVITSNADTTKTGTDQNGSFSRIVEAGNHDLTASMNGDTFLETSFSIAEGESLDLGDLLPTKTFYKADKSFWYEDADGDGYGNPDVVIIGKEQPPGFVSDNSDCNDADASINPSAPEICGNGVDEDCDGGDNVCADTTAPRIMGVTSTDNTTVIATFSEPVSEGAEDPSHYQITSPKLCSSMDSEASSLTVTSAVLSADQTAVTLTTLSQSEVTYTLTVTNVKDLAGNQIAPPDRDNPYVPTFAGTPESGERTDSDGDGLADSEEQLGWGVTVTYGDGTQTCSDVTSDPYLTDTDSDGVGDLEEQIRTTNPRDDDTDNDGLMDYDEINGYYSDALAQDSDSDKILDGDEVNVYETSPALDDTDGDSYTDYDEIFVYSSPPLIADVPQAAIDLVGTARIDLNITYTDQSTYTSSVENRTEDETQFSSSTQEVTATNSIGASKEGWFASINPIGLIDAAVGLISGDTSKLGGIFQDKTITTTEETSETWRKAYAEMESHGRELTEETSSGYITIGLQVKNTGTISFTLNNLSVTALNLDPYRSAATEVLTTLKPAVEEITLGPGAQTGTIVVENAEAPATLIKDLLANPTGLSFEVATFDLLDEAGRNFAFLDQVTKSRTALITIDFGDGTVEHYRVATDVQRNPDGTSAGITMDKVLNDILELDYEIQQGTIIAEDGELHDQDTLIRVEDITRDKEAGKFWVILGSSASHVTPGLNFNDMILKGGDTIILAYVTDVDGDGLFAREEFYFGTKDSDPDTDGDGLTDYEEVKLGWDVTTDEVTRVYSDPRSSDSDRDGLIDPDECGVQWDENGDAERDSAGNLICTLGTDPNNPDTDGDTLCDGPGRLDNSQDPDDPYSICEITDEQDPNPLEPALYSGPSLIIVYPLPNTINADPSSDVIAMFDQKMDETSTFSVHGSMTGTPYGSFGFYFDNEQILTFNPDLQFKPGEEIEVTLTDKIKNIDNFIFEPPYVYRFLTAVTGTGSGGAFSPAVNYATGHWPYSVITGDLDNDGDIDLAAANSGSDDVSILLNNSDGTFTTATTYWVGHDPSHITAADLDSDGDLDLATACPGSDYIAVLLNNGDGTFAAVVNYSSGGYPNHVETGDFDGDGDIDLAAANFHSHNVSVLLNNGDGTFTTAVSYSVGEYPIGLTTADFDSDGDLDLSTANGNNLDDDVSILLNNSDGTFVFSANYSLDHTYIYSLTSGDLDGNGSLDLVVADGYEKASVMLNNGDGTFGSPSYYSIGSGTFEVTAGDFDGDGDLDLATANRYSDDVSVLLNNGDGTFAAAATYWAGDYAQSITAGDFDGDGDLDLATANYATDNVSILLNE